MDNTRRVRQSEAVNQIATDLMLGGGAVRKQIGQFMLMLRSDGHDLSGISEMLDSLAAAAFHARRLVDVKAHDLALKEAREASASVHATGL